MLKEKLKKIPLPIKLALIFTLLFGFAVEAKKGPVHQIQLQEGLEFLYLDLYRTDQKEIIHWYGALSDLDYNDVKKFLKQIQPGKDIDLFIRYGGGGSVAKHKKFVKSIFKKCEQSRPKNQCQITTYLAGRCASMCTTLFLKGHKRIAGDHPQINLGLHKTQIQLGNRIIPVQGPDSMARYFTDFDRVNKDYVMANRNIFFNQPKNYLYEVHGQELLDTGFADILDPNLDRFVDFLRDYHGI